MEEHNNNPLPELVPVKLNDEKAFRDAEEEIRLLQLQIELEKEERRARNLPRIEVSMSKENVTGNNLVTDGEGDVDEEDEEDSLDYAEEEEYEENIDDIIEHVGETVYADRLPPSAKEELRQIFKYVRRMLRRMKGSLLTKKTPIDNANPNPYRAHAKDRVLVTSSRLAKYLTKKRSKKKIAAALAAVAVTATAPALIPYIEAQLDTSDKVEEIVKHSLKLNNIHKWYNSLTYGLEFDGVDDEGINCAAEQNIENGEPDAVSCSNMMDDDGDGLYDCADPDCDKFCK